MLTYILKKIDDSRELYWNAADGCWTAYSSYATPYISFPDKESLPTGCNVRWVVFDEDEKNWYIIIENDLIIHGPFHDYEIANNYMKTLDEPLSCVITELKQPRLDK